MPSMTKHWVSIESALAVAAAPAAPRARFGEVSTSRVDIGHGYELAIQNGYKPYGYTTLSILAQKNYKRSFFVFDHSRLAFVVRCYKLVLHRFMQVVKTHVRMQSLH